MLGLNKSTVSRQVSKGLIPNHGTAWAPLIDVGEARAVRDRDLDKSKRHDPPEDAPGDLLADDAAPSLTEQRRRRAAAEAEMAELGGCSPSASTCCCRALTWKAHFLKSANRCASA